MTPVQRRIYLLNKNVNKGIQKEKENRKKYREFQGKRKHLETLVEDEEKEAKALSNT